MSENASWGVVGRTMQWVKTGVSGLWAVKQSWGHREVEVRVPTLSRGSLADHLCFLQFLFISMPGTTKYVQ